MNWLHQLERQLLQIASPRRSHTFWGLLLLLVICFGLIWLKHGTWLRTPNEYLLGTSPDGIKNYATAMWHVRYDSSFVHYEGMNYPYGEHALFTDNQPIFCAGMQWWHRHVFSLSERTAGVINLFQVFSLLLGCIVLFLLWRKLHVPVWYAIPLTLGMLFLSPQYGRFDGHFALSHTWVFPLLLLLLSHYEERYSRRYQSLLIGLLLWVTAQLHFYYFGLCSLFLILYTVYQLIREPSLRNLRVRFSHLVVMVLLPLALLNIWLHWADYAADRPASPFGFTTYIGEWEGVFLPYESFPLFQWIDQHLVSIRRVNGETKAYAGAVAFLFTLWLLLSRFRLFDKSWDETAYHRVHKRYLQGIFAAALVLLLFACGFPFAIKGMTWMVDYMGPLRQFRGLGRFTWAYYYVINLLAFYAIWNWSVRFKGLKGGRAKWLRWVIALGPLLILCWEAYTFQRLRPLPLVNTFEKHESTVPETGPWLTQVDFTPYQAFLPLPYYHLGSENIWWEFSYDQFLQNKIISLRTGKPDMGVNLSRTSIGQTMNSIQLMLEPCRSPAILNELPDNRPLALVVFGPAWDDVRQRYPHLVSKAIPVFDDPKLRVLSLPIDSIRAYVREHSQGVEAERLRRRLTPEGAWQVSQPGQALVYQSCDSLSSATHIFQGAGAFEGRMCDTTWLYRSQLPKGRYVLSFWMYVNQDQGMNHEVKLAESDLADGRQIQFRPEATQFYLKSIVNGWGLFELPFDVNGEQSRLQLFLQKESANTPFFLDEVLIRPENTDVYRRESLWVVRNNYWYKL